MVTVDLASSPTTFLEMPDGARIAVWDTGGDLSPVVFLHGFPENRLCWKPVLDLLRRDVGGFRWIAYDLRGFGESDKVGEASWRRMVADHLEITRQLDLNRHHLVGHDWGAAITLHLARLAPESLESACVLNTTFWKVDYRGMWHLWLMNLPAVPTAIFRCVPDWFFHRTMARAFRDPSRLDADSSASYLQMFRDPETTRFWIRLYRNVLRTVLGSALPAFLRRRPISSSTELPPASGGAFRLPFRVIWGAQDTFCPLWVGRAIEQRLREYGAEVEFIEVEDSGHFVTEEQPAEVAILVREWLRARGGR